MKLTMKLLFGFAGAAMIISAIVYFSMLSFNDGSLFGIAAGLILLLFGVIYKFNNKPINIASCSLLLIFICLLSFLGVYGNSNTSDGKENYIIVLGCGLKDGDTVSGNLKYRLDKSAELSKINPDAKIIVSGGQGKNENVSEAEAMSDYLISKGINEEMIIKESASTSTYENLTFSKEIMDNSGDDYSVCVVTNNYHIFRLKKLSEELDIHLTYAGAKSYLPTIPVCYTRELIAIAYSYL